MSTIRQAIISLLSDGEQSAKTISKSVRISEKEVYDHLSHIYRTVKSQNKRLKIIPAQCLECGYVFEDRTRFTSPGRCPRCRGEHVEDPMYLID